MPYAFSALISVSIFALVHLQAGKIKHLKTASQARFLSAGGGVALAYVFINLMPKLCFNDALINKSFSGIFPFLERHVFLMALLGFLLFLVVDRAPRDVRGHRKYYLSLGSYALFNFLVGYSVMDKNDPEVQPLSLFTFALSLHYFANDYALNKHHGKEYNHKGKWILIFSLYLGWFTGLWYSLPAVAIAVVTAFIGGGVIMNVIRHEIPKDNPSNLMAFILSTSAYTALLLIIQMINKM